MANFLDPVLNWLLIFHPALSIILVSLLISLIVTLALKYLTNQTMMKDLREELKTLQKEMKNLRNNPKKMAKINERFMESNMKYMSHSMKPTLYTFIPVLLVFGWLNAHLAYQPLLPGQEFTLTAVFETVPEGNMSLDAPNGINIISGPAINSKEAVWQLTGNEGNYDVTLAYKGQNYTKSLVITRENYYAPVEQDYRKHFLFFSQPNDTGLNKIILGNMKILPFADVPLIKDIPWIGTWSWFGVYIVASLVFSLLLRKLMKVY